MAQGGGRNETLQCRVSARNARPVGGPKGMTQDYIGVDLSKDWLDVFDPAHGKARRVKNAPRSVRAWLGKLRADVCVVIEATSGCDALIMAEAAASGVGLARVNPGRARSRGGGWSSWCGGASSSRTWKRRRNSTWRRRPCPP